MVLRTGDLLICWIVADLSAIGVALARAEGVLAFVKELIQILEQIHFEIQKIRSDENFVQ